MNLSPHKPNEPDQSAGTPGLQVKERIIVLAVIGFVLLSALWHVRAPSPSPKPSDEKEAVPTAALSPEKIPLTTGEEPIAEIFTRSGCPVCHIIPGIPGARGQVGPVLALGSTGARRLSDPAYAGNAKTVHEYVVESVLDPERFIVPGYPGHTMPTWYGSKLSALALEKIADYLERQTEGG